MNTEILNAKFARIGARLKIEEGPGRRARRESTTTLDVRVDRHGEYFELRRQPTAEPEIVCLDVQPDARHLLLLFRAENEKSKFLCGHDERHWFVAAIPESAPTGNVRQAMEALKPAEVILAQNNMGLGIRQRNRRKNTAFVRQGEWFFLPEPHLVVKPQLVFPNEPLSRGTGSKPHWVEYCYRTGGEEVRVCSKYPSGVTNLEYRQILRDDPMAQLWGWRVMRRNAEVYAQGRIRHADHATIRLPFWHRVVMNTERHAKAMQHVAFLD